MNNQSKPKLIPIKEWPKHHAAPSIRHLRHLIFNADMNGFDMCIKRIGRRVFIDEQAFFIWLEQQNPTQER